MMRALKQKPTLDRPATYQIQVPGELDESWSDWIQAMTIAFESEGEDPPVTTLTGPVADQPALHGLLKRVRGWEYPCSRSIVLNPARQTQLISNS